MLTYGGHLVPSLIQHQGYLCALQQYRPHRTQPRLQGLFEAFFYHAFTELSSHLMDIASVKVQLFGNLIVGQIQSHEIEAQYPNFEGLMMSGKNGSCEIIKAFSAIFAFIALPGGVLIVVTFFDCAYGITKRALTPFWPTKFANSLIALHIIYQGLYVYFHQLQSVCNQLVVGLIATIIWVSSIMDPII